MQTIDIRQLRDDLDAFVDMASQEDVAVTKNGQVVVILTRPREIPGRREYLKEREQRLATVKLLGEWDSTQAISEDRDR